MHFRLIIIIFLFLAAITTSCKKDSIAASDCFSNVSTLRQIVNKPAIIESVEGQFYIVEEGSIDTKLIPCNLPREFLINNLKVIVSGDIKLSIQAGAGPCCSENLIITKITK